MKKLLLFICLSMCFWGCKKENQLKVSTKTYRLNSEFNCVQNNCTYAYIEVPFFEGRKNIVKPINDSIFNFIEQTIRFKGDKKVKSYDTLALNFINHYNEVYLTYPENALAWEANFKVSNNSMSSKLHQVVYEYYLFIGGAHGTQATKVFIFDTTTGQILPKNELFVNFKGFKNYAETEFRKQLNVSGSLKDSGFNFENNQFQLPKNFYQTNTEWILHYNPNEIATFGQGAIQIKLSNNDVERFLNPIYFKN